MELSENAKKIAEDRYFMVERNEDWESCAWRVGKVVANAENSKTIEYTEKFSEMIYDMYFLPGGRIFRNAGRPRGSMFNCYHLPIGDSREEIGQYYKDSLILWGEGGGIGVNVSSLRPCGAPIKGVGGTSSGPVSFLEASDSIANTIESGGSRRAAALAAMNVSHPDILKFIDAKLVHGKLSHFNISVAVTEDFLEAVESNRDWEFKFANRSYGKVPAIEIWNKIIDNMVNHAEPGLLNWDNLIKNNSYYYDQVTGTNPCSTGETLVAVADGREVVPIQVLAEEGKDVPVFCLNRFNNRVEVKMMRNPRITGYNKKIFKVILDDGSYIRCTENHKLMMKDGNSKEVKDLQCGDRLHHMVKYNASFEEIFKGSNSKSNDYVWINSGFGNTVAEHRVIAEFFMGRRLKSGEVVHHEDYDSLNNHPTNLSPMLKEKHDRLHSEDMLGDKNPMNRFPEKNWLIKQNHSGKNNGRHKGFEHIEIFEFMVEYMVKLGRKITFKEWERISKKNNFPHSKYILGKFTSFDKMITEASKQANIYKAGPHLKEYKRYLEIKECTDLDVFFDKGSIYVEKKCEYCGENFVVKWGLRERCFCTRLCSSKYAHKNEDSIRKFKVYYKNKQLNVREQQIGIFNSLCDQLEREPLKIEWKNTCKSNNVPYRIRSVGEVNINEYCFRSFKELKHAATLNFKIVNIVEDGYENVYNGTVDDNHNFYILMSESKTRSGKKKLSYINNFQCGEAVLAPYDVCDLGSLVLPNFITGTVNTNWKKLEEIIELAVRFLDDVIDVNKYVLHEIDIKAHNSRRIGLGVMGLAEYLFAKKLKYGSAKSIVEIERLMRFIRDKIYETLIKLSIEKGSFPKFDPIAYGKASFIRKLPVSLRMSVKEHGVRCVTGMAMAPTGTISLLADVTSGVEPLFRKAYKRRDRVGERIYIHDIYKNLLANGEETPEWYADTDDLNPSDHFEVQSIVQKYTDGAVSKTINMPVGTTPEELSKLTLEYIRDLKGVTVYVDGSREGQILNKISHEEAMEHFKKNDIANDVGPEAVACALGKCDL